MLYQFGKKPNRCDCVSLKRKPERHSPEQTDQFLEASSPERAQPRRAPFLVLLLLLRRRGHALSVEAERKLDAGQSEANRHDRIVSFWCLVGGETHPPSLACASASPLLSAHTDCL